MTLRKKSVKTYAKPSPYQNIFQVVGPGKGGQIEVLIAWHERILQTCHFPVGPTVSIGTKANINLPMGTMIRKFNLLESRNGQAFINLPFESKSYLQKFDDCSRLQAATYRLHQNEVVFISFGNNIHLAIRFAPLTSKITPESSLFFSPSEWTAILSALIMTTFTSLVVSVMKPKFRREAESIDRVAQVIFERSALRILPPAPLPTPISPTPLQLNPEPGPSLQTSTDRAIAPKVSKVKQSLQKVRPKVLSIAQGADKIQPKNLEISKSGLMSVLDSVGFKEKIDQANRGTTELIGDGEKALGLSGINDNSIGTDLDQKFKTVGESGSGTATVGLSQVKTNSNGLEIGDLESGEKFGKKQNLKIVAGGDEERFLGAIDKAAVRRAVRSHLHAIKYCYEREYKKNSSLQGKIVIAWEIRQEGIAQNVRVVKNQTTISNLIVEECVRAVIETIKFPEPPQNAIVEVTGFPFIFSGLK